MTAPFVCRATATAALLLLAACGSSYSRPLYTPVSGSRPSLVDGEIRMTTHWTSSPDEVPDVRAVVCSQGIITCSYDSRHGRREGWVSEAEWNDLWARLEPVAPWSPSPLSVKPNDPSGGPYHVVYLRAGNQISQFSSQMRADLLVFTSREVSDRLGYTNLIVDFVSAHARTPATAPPMPAETRPSSTP
jgi:hypothetical protein